jgi:aminomethyltransferase
VTEEAIHTALHDRHVAAGARFTTFGGWEMPLRYGSIIDEHTAVRTAVGLFDLSHMGELEVSGPEADAGLAAALTNDATRLPVGRAQYSLICEPDGGVIDDLIVYRTGDEAFLVVPNAANAPIVASELRRRLEGRDAALHDATLETSLIAVQGPSAIDVLLPLTDAALDGLRPYAAIQGRVAGIDALIARTGYTGEDGFELFVGWSAGPALWGALISAGDGAGGRPIPCGLGARDTLRLEAGMPLYGNELDRTTTPLQAGLERFAAPDREPGFVGREALRQEAVEGPARRLVGLELRGPGIARHGHAVHRPEEPDTIGIVTSGTHSPTLGRAIAMAYVPPDATAAGTMLEVEIRGANVPAVVVDLPFYRRARR